MGRVRKVKNCPICSHEFTSSKTHYTYCSIECYKIFQKKDNLRKCRLRHDTPNEKTCSICGSTFPTKKGQVYCSNECFRINAKRQAHSQRWKINARNATLQRRIENTISAAIRKALLKAKGGQSWEFLVGYTTKTLIAHLESKFTDGMTWENYGKWHIDHKIPKSWFYYESPDDWQFKVCWSLWNLQPLWAADNIRKRNRYAT